MTTDYAGGATFISDERIAEMEAKGREARRECRSRQPAAGTFSEIERKAYVRGWDKESDRTSMIMGTPRT